MPIKLVMTMIVGDLPTWAKETLSNVFDSDDLTTVLNFLRANADDDWIRDWSIEESETEETEVLRES